VSTPPTTTVAVARSEAATADAVAAAAAGCPAVASLHGGGLLRTATYLPGRLVEGVHVDDDRVRVSVVALHGVPVAVVAGQVREAVGGVVPGRAVDVHVADVRLPTESAPARPPA
jgi:uncharacterized alkaline shock family protein YloU